MLRGSVRSTGAAQQPTVGRVGRVDGGGSRTTGRRMVGFSRDNGVRLGRRGVVAAIPNPPPEPAPPTPADKGGRPVLHIRKARVFDGLLT